MTEQSLPGATFTELVSVESAIRDLPLNEMEASLLRTAISTEVARMGHDTALFERAIDLATYLHRAKHRRQRGPMQLVHYVEHPLRNTLRAIRYGVNDERTLLAIVFHDTVVDHVWELVRLATMPGTAIADEAAAREIAFGCLAYHFGYLVARAVRGMTNDLLPAGPTRAEKNVRYVGRRCATAPASSSASSSTSPARPCRSTTRWTMGSSRGRRRSTCRSRTS